MGVDNVPAKLSDIEFGLFKQFIEEKCGIEIPKEKAYFIESRLSSLLFETGASGFDELYQIIRNNQNLKITAELIDHITTNETSWFRDKAPWNTMESRLLPGYISQLRSGKKNKIRIWSAAASTGQESYSTAMFIDSWLEKNGIQDITLAQFEIMGTDISHTVLEFAKNARYDATTMTRGLDPYYKDKYFEKDGLDWKLGDKIKKAVQFKQFNLQNSFLSFGKFDIIFCRYVLLYFPNTLKESIASKLLNSTLEDSILFIGASELCEEIEKYFKLTHEEVGTYYVRRT